MNVKAITVVNTHERRLDYLMSCCKNALDMLSSGVWNYKGVKSKIYKLSELDLAHEDHAARRGNAIRSIVDCTKW